MFGFVTGVGRIVRRYADGTDTGECSIKVFTRNVLFFAITGVYGGTGTCGKHRDRCGDPWEDQEVVLCFTYTLVSTDSLILVESREE